ncbi:alpha-L-fucosidase [Pontiellaceae bacterium B12227]|nr:alpha-L-fucosidase [Pontiellaceae bacterium B12227]
MGYKSCDHNWKSTEALIQNFVDIVSKGGNYLLNVGPTATGAAFKPYEIGSFTVGKAGEYTLHINPVQKGGGSISICARSNGFPLNNRACCRPLTARA